MVARDPHSIESKPCQAELQYAQALGLSILPVQVGSVDSMQLNPLATVQAIDYRHPTPGTAMRLSAALHRERAHRRPLPEPLPDEPPVPFEYLIRLFTTISNPEYLTPRDLAARRPITSEPARRRSARGRSQRHRHAAAQATRPRRRHLPNPNRRRGHPRVRPRGTRRSTTASHSDHYASRGKSRVYRTAGPTTESLEPRYKDLDCRRFRARGCGGDSGNGRRNPPVSEAGPRRRRFRSNPNVFEPGRHHKRFPRSPIVIAFKPGQRPRRRGLVGAAAVVRCGVVVRGSRR